MTSTYWVRLALYLLITLSVVNLADSRTTKWKEIDLSIINHSGKNLVVDWVNPKTGKVIGVGGIKDGEMTHINSFVNHTFAIREQDTNEICNNSNDHESSGCTIKYIIVHEKTDQGKILNFSL